MMEKSKSALVVPEIKVSSFGETRNNKNDVNESLLKPDHESNNKHKKDSFESFHLDIPSRFLPRQSVVSRLSIEQFLSTFPTNDTEFANQEIINAVQDIIHSNIGLNEQMTCSEKIRLIIESQKFHFFLIGLVVLDCICVILQVILDIVSKDLYDHTLHLIEETVEIISVIILSLFMLSIFFHMIFLPKLFFKSKLEIFDALIVVISFILEIVSIIKKDSVREIEAAVITFRFWRIIRIVNAIVITVEKRVYQKLDNLKNDVKNVVDENIKMEAELDKKEAEIKKLNKQIEDKNKDLNEIQLKFQLFITENQKLRLNEKIQSDCLRLDIKKSNTKLTEMEQKLKELFKENEDLKSKMQESENDVPENRNNEN